MVIDLCAIWIELDTPLFYISIPFPKGKDLVLVCTIRKSAPVNPFSAWTQPPPFTDVFSISKPSLLLCIVHRLYYSP